MPLFLITARCHVLDVNLFEQFLVVLHPWLLDHVKYAYSVEEDDTINRHIHFVVEDNAKDRDALSRKFTTKTFKPFKEHLSSTNTIWDTFLNIQVIKKAKEDVLKSLGYCLKDNTKRRGSKGFSEPFILEATKYYFVTKHMDKSILKRDEILITSKNIFAHVKDFVKSNNLSITDPSIQYLMTQQNYSFLNINPKQIKRAFTEMAIMLGDTDPELKSIIFYEQQGIENQLHHDLDNHVKHLLEEIETHIPPDEMSSKTQWLFKTFGNFKQC